MERIRICTCLRPDGRKCGAEVSGSPYRCPYHGLLADGMTEIQPERDINVMRTSADTVDDDFARKLKLLAEGKPIF